MAETLAIYLDRWISKTTSGGFRNPLVKMPVKRFHRLDAAALTKLENGSSLTLGTLSDPIARNLIKNYEEKIRERGEHTGFATFGSVEVTLAASVSGGASKVALMPVWLKRVELQKKNGTVTVKPPEDQIWDLNPELEPMLAPLAIKPSAGPKETTALVNWLAAQAGNRAVVDCNSSFIGCFSSQHLLIRERIKDTRWRRAVARNDAIRAKVLKETGVDLISNSSPVSDSNIESLGLVLPIDDSQLRVVQLASEGRSLVVQGPPGTGKSQTIANLIANAWWQGKRVMLVCDKRTAIQQVEERLQKCGLGAALLNIHDEGLDKKSFLEQATATFKNCAVSNGRHPFNEIAQLREVLNKRVRDGESLAHGSIPIKRREALAGMIRLRDEIGSVPRVDIPNWQSLSRERLAKLFTNLKAWESLKLVAANSTDAWNSVKSEAFHDDPNAKQEVAETSARVHATLVKVGELRELAVASGWRTELVGMDDLLALKEMSELVRRRPTHYVHLIDNSDVNISSLLDLKSAHEEKVGVVSSSHPVRLGSPTPAEARINADELLSKEESLTWKELVEKVELHKRSLHEIEHADQDYLRLATAIGLVVLSQQGARRAQLNSVCQLQALSVRIPTAWWDPAQGSPSGTLNRWEKEIQSLSNHAKVSPMPVDFAAVERTPEEAWKQIEAKAEDGFNAVSYCFRYIKDRKAKSALQQIYPDIVTTQKVRWADLVLHAIKARAILLQIKASCGVHSDLRDHTSAYFATSVEQPDVKSLLKSVSVTKIRDAVRLVEAMRHRTDQFNTLHPVWASIWEAPSTLRLTEIDRCLTKWTALKLPDPSNDEIQHGRSQLLQRIKNISEFLQEHMLPSGNPEHSVVYSLDARDHHYACHVKLQGLERYAFIPSAQSAPPDWDAIRLDLEWRDAFQKVRSNHRLDLDSSNWNRVHETVSNCITNLKDAINKLGLYFRNTECWNQSFTDLIEVLLRIELGMASADSWLLKADWQAKIGAWPELRPFWERTVSGETKPEHARPLFCYNLLRQTAPPVEPNGQEHSAILQAFQAQDEQLVNWTIDALQAKVWDRQRSAAAKHSESCAELTRLGSLQRIRGTIREICSQHLGLLLDSKPGWLMSPVSLANFFDLDVLNSGEPVFDTVIFDEASQVQVMEGLLAMGFARQTIIVGDDNQLPPTNFFAAMISEEEDTDDLGESESLIEEFHGAVQSVMLMAHYRSETPDLISFSNRKFYGGKLEMYPPAKVTGIGRRRVFVSNGRFDSGKGKTHRNLEEAKAVVKLVAEHVDRSPGKSLGVVSMNAEQMDLIEELLLAAPTKVRIFCDDEERFFIRNLESVQGDEMDRIIVSLTYGKNQEGNFNASILGPITKRGGHRRLNVALSRSKSGMTIVTSMTAADISETSAQSTGVLCLRDLLHELETTSTHDNYGMSDARFAQRRDGVSETVYCESPFEEQVVDFLENEGYEIKCQVGAGMFRIDIVVFENSMPILAVECDGAAYHSSNSARTRDRARQRHLERLGWKFHRVWSTNWWLFPDTEKETLRLAIRTARQNNMPSRTATAMGAEISARAPATMNGDLKHDLVVDEASAAAAYGRTIVNIQPEKPPQPTGDGKRVITGQERGLKPTPAAGQPKVPSTDIDDTRLEYWATHPDWPSIVVGKRLKWISSFGIVTKVENNRYIVFRDEIAGTSLSISVPYVESFGKRK